jgi:Ca-activated chloride channel family protein
MQRIDDSRRAATATERAYGTVAPLGLAALTFLSGCFPFLFEDSDWAGSDAMVSTHSMSDRESFPEHLWCNGPSATGVGVANRSVSYDIRVEGDAVDATMEVLLCGTGQEPEEAVLRFPLPEGAVIRGAEIFLAGQDRWEAAETVGRREGEAIYEDVVTPDEPIDPLLIQRIGLDLYRARVFPVDAWVGGRFRIHYAHVLERSDEARQLSVALEDPDALPFDPERGLHVSVSAEPGAWSGGAWAEGTPDRHDFDPEGGSGSVEIASEQIDRDLVLELIPAEPLLEASTLSYTSTAEGVADHTFVAWLPDFADHPALFPRPRNVVFVVDVSGSMSGRKIEQMKAGLGHALGSLSGDDRFGLVAFDSDTYVFRSEMSSVDDVSQAIRWAEALTAGSSTAMADGLVQAARIGLGTLRQGERLDVLLITDGLPNEGPDTPETILAAIGEVTEDSSGSIRLFGCGMGYDLDQAFLNDLVQPTGGEATFALDDSEITGQILDLFDRVRDGGLEDVLVVVEGLEDDATEIRRLFPGTILSLGLSGALDDELDLALAGLAPDRTSVTLSARVALTPAGSEGIHRVAPALAAKAWADRLERRIDEEGETEELVQEAVVLARRYGILTRYSSMLALETPEMYDEYGVQRPARDLAGIALEDVSGSTADEHRIGGEGTTADTAMEASMDGCTCSASGNRPPSQLVLLLAALAAFLGWQRRRS